MAVPIPRGIRLAQEGGEQDGARQFSDTRLRELQQATCHAANNPSLIIAPLSGRAFPGLKAKSQTVILVNGCRYFDFRDEIRRRDRLGRGFGEFAQEFEQGATRFRRLGFGRFLARITDELADLLNVGFRVHR